MKIAKYVMADAFGLDISTKVQATGFAGTSAYIPKVDKHYKFRKKELLSLWMFLEEPNNDALFITGPTGSGKTSLVTQYAARVSWPVQEVTAHGRMELADLIGFHTLQSDEGETTPTMRFQYGPLSRAMKEGHIFLINEVDMIDPGELSGLNDVLEGRPLVLSANGGEVINPHPAFRVIVTANSVGSGDMTGLYSGIKTLNIASMDRYRMMEVGYPEQSVEEEILNKVAPVLPEAIRVAMVQLANQIRDLFIGCNESEGSLSVTMSTRTLVRWAKTSQTFHGLGSPKPLSEALEQALLLRCQPEEREAIERMAKLTFGDSF